MREFNPLTGYPEPKHPRVVGSDIRTIENRIIATYRGEEYYDGDRNNGYGGFRYDGRWAPIAKDMYGEYGLQNDSAVLQVGCEKGFLLHDFIDQYSGLKVRGTDISAYAIEHSMESVKPLISNAPFTQLPYEDNEFDLVVAIGVVYTLNLADAMQCLKEIERVSKGASFVTLAAYRTEEEKMLWEWWTVLGATLLHEDEWVRVMQHAGYTGDYKFTTARSLKLIKAE
jgi:ubiquinone/menaquinone biosynthesis C-methylase UbiE